MFPPVARSPFGFRNTLNAANNGGLRHPRLCSGVAVGGTANFYAPEIPENASIISRFVTTLIFVSSICHS